MSNALRELRVEAKTEAKRMVEIVKRIYPKYDKTCQSKCENTESYGVMLAPDAMELLKKELLPPATEPIQKRHGKHRFNCRISCRLPDGQYEELLHCINAEGYATIQGWLAEMVRQHLQEKKEGSGNERA